MNTSSTKPALQSASRKKLRASARCLPERPGVYIMLDMHGTVLYVGKAVNLRRRVSSYSTDSAMRERKIEKLVSQFDSLSYIQTQSEIEALLVESRLIKAKMPIFNRQLTEPESCCFFRIDRNEGFPGIQLVPTRREDGSWYIGPVWRSTMARDAVEAVADLFRLRHCSGNIPTSARRGCMYYEFHKCSGPCTGAVSGEEYAGQVDAALRILSGESNEAVRKLTECRDGYVEALKFEMAAKVQEQIRALEYVSSCADSAIPSGSFAAVVPSYLRARPVVLLFSHGRLVWKALAGPRAYPDETMIAERLAQLDSQTCDILPGKPSSDDFLILQSYMRRKHLESMITPISPKLPVSASAQSVLNLIDAMRIARR